jgi:hypothetical protein
VLGLLFAAAICALGVAAIKRQQAATHPPKVISKVKNLEVVSVTVEQESHHSEPMVVIIIRNNSDQAVVSVAVESGDDKDASGISTDGFKEGNELPSAVIEPFGTIKMQMLLGNLLPGKPLKVSGAMYADGSVDGEKLATETIREHKERARRGENKKGDSPLQ